MWVRAASASKQGSRWIIRHSGYFGFVAPPTPQFIVMRENMHIRQNLNFLGLILVASVLSGCASGAVLNSIRSESLGILNPFALIVGLGIVWYCWVEAKRKNRNTWTWLILGFVFGFFALLVLVYLKDLPAATQTTHNKADEPDVKS